MLTIVVLFINFSLFKAIAFSFFYFFCFAIYKMVDNMDIYNSLNINIGTVTKNP